MAQERNDRDWMRSADSAKRAFRISDSAASRLDASFAARYLDQIDRIRQQVEGPAKQYIESLERARKLAEGPANQALDFLERVRSTAEGPTKQYLEAAERARAAADGPVRRYADMAEQARTAAEGPTRRALEMVEQARMVVEGPARRMQEHHERLTRLLAGYDFGAALRRAAAIGAQVEHALAESLPVNWRPLSFDDAERVERLVRDEGVPLVWVPSAILTAKVASASTGAEAMNILLAEQEEVLVDIEQTLDDVTASEFAVLVDKTRKAVAALRGGHGDAAQALAAAVFTTAAHCGLGHKDLQDVRKEADRNSPDKATLAAYRGTLVVQLASRYVQGRGYELPGFNRSTSLHRVEAAQYTPANNLAAVMAATSVLREGQARSDGSQV